MPRQLRVHLDLERIRQHLASEDGRELSITEVRQWLIEAGFSARDDGWLVAEPDLGQLNPDEVLSVHEDD